MTPRGRPLKPGKASEAEAGGIIADVAPARQANCTSTGKQGGGCGGFATAGGKVGAGGTAVFWVFFGKQPLVSANYLRLEAQMTQA